ncbi:phytanoyl-CoA dioxygenase family protein [Nonomuraea aridisoli]|uniref:Mitomycin antibiotics/polyketide fumonisin biosynthesis protein n=1 Tax=Nonomuraea aridisoli TaxID=2070368 RepID=A0A2W2FUI1_9ACTN|nr:phytanoyl-CoA dioxygenase family protein [Nonomuraea aridisoli]PZG18534.1 mitomycin antibiotics/polyketide fumonisin biosynthesis protein [Nonomuraea aridisoli]
MDVVDIDQFVTDGFAKIDGVVPREVGDAARALLWQRIGLSPDDPSGWTQPVVWTADLTGEGPFGEFMRSPRLYAALDAIAGPDRWVPRGVAGNIPVRFPRVPPADDRGWHIDANTERPDGSWGVSGRPGTLLLLVIFSDVGPDDAPTRVRVGSHRDVAGILDEKTIDAMEAGPLVDDASRGRPLAFATGRPGDAYVLHPFTVHAAQEHLGTEPRFMAQMPIPLTERLAPGAGTPLARAVGW